MRGANSGLVEGVVGLVVDRDHFAARPLFGGAAGLIAVALPCAIAASTSLIV
jgi:hypothetical protein